MKHSWYAGVLFAALLTSAALMNACGDSGGSTTDPSPNQGTTTPTTFNIQVSAANEVPTVNNAESVVTGNATITLRTTKDAAGTVTAATADFSANLSGFPGSSTLTMAHIHRAAAGVQGGIVVDTGLTTQSAGTSTITRNGVTVPPDIAQAILNDASGFYFNIHSAMNAPGVARGQLTGSSAPPGGSSGGSSGGSADGY